MAHPRLLIALVLTGWLATAAYPSAQAPGSRNDSAFQRWEAGPYLGVSLHSPAGTRYGVTPDRNHLFIGLHLTANILRSRRWAFGYAPELVPLLLMTNNPAVRIRLATNGRSFSSLEKSTVAGFAISPIGLEGQVQVASRWRAYGAGALGGVWFTGEVPVPGSRAFNYTFEVGGGMLWRYRSRDSLRIGYKFHHLSNAYTAPKNPGVDAAVFLVGFERAFGSR